MTNPHPNATIALITGTAATMIGWALHRAGADISPAEAAALATGATTLALALGKCAWPVLHRDGLAGLWRLVLHGPPRT